MFFRQLDGKLSISTSHTRWPMPTIMEKCGSGLYRENMATYDRNTPAAPYRVISVNQSIATKGTWAAK